MSNRSEKRKMWSSAAGLPLFNPVDTCFISKPETTALAAMDFVFFLLLGVFFICYIFSGKSIGGLRIHDAGVTEIIYRYRRYTSVVYGLRGVLMVSASRPERHGKAVHAFILNLIRRGDYIFPWHCRIRVFGNETESFRVRLRLLPAPELQPRRGFPGWLPFFPEKHLWIVWCKCFVSFPACILTIMSNLSNRIQVCCRLKK